MSGVLISGGTQPLGLQLAERLLAAGQGPVMLVGYGPPDAVLVPEHAVYEQVDLTDARQAQALMAGPVRALALSTVVNLAFHRTPRRDHAAHAFNVEVTRSLLQLAERHPTVRLFVHRSASDVYSQRLDEPDVMREDRPLNLDPAAPPWIRDRVEVDTLVCGRSGLARELTLCVLRCAEILAPGTGSQLYDYLDSRVCLRRMGFDPMLNLLSLRDAVRAFELSVRRAPSGPINVPGADTLPLSRAIRRWGRDGIPVPSALLGPLYGLRRMVRGRAFRYDANVGRFHYNAVLDGTRAREVMGYEPEHPIDWPG